MFFVLSLLGCSQDSKDPNNPPSQPDSADTAVIVEQGICEQLGLEAVPFNEDSTVARYGNIVEDFTIETTEGPWSFLESWTGCESYLFLNYHPDYEYPVQIWESDFTDLIASSPPNVHYFFTSLNQGSEASEVTALQERFDQELLSLGEDEQE